jgi:DNA-binding XRE family transcriptional regulator
LGEFSRRLPPALQDQWAVAPLPSAEGEGVGASLAGGASVAMFSGSRRKSAAWKLIEYLCAPSSQIELYRLTGDLPSRRAVWDEKTLATNPRIAAFHTQLQSLRSTPQIPEWERIAEKVSQYAEAAVRQTMTAEEALTALDADIDRILEKRRYLLKDRTPTIAVPFCSLTLSARKPASAAYPKELKSLGDHIRKRRLDLGLLQKDVAQRLSVSEASIWNWETHRSNPQTYLIPGLCAAPDGPQLPGDTPHLPPRRRALSGAPGEAGADRREHDRQVGAGRYATDGGNV